MTRAILLAGAFLLGLAIGRRRPREEWRTPRYRTPLTETVPWVDPGFWRDFERVDSV